MYQIIEITDVDNPSDFIGWIGTFEIVEDKHNTGWYMGYFRKVFPLPAGNRAIGFINVRLEEIPDASTNS